MTLNASCGYLARKSVCALITQAGAYWSDPYTARMIWDGTYDRIIKLN